MSAWGVGPFENDAASDFADDYLARGLDLEYFDTLLNAAYVEVDAGEVLVAAASVVAAGNGGDDPHPHIYASKFVPELGPDRVAALRRQLARVLDGPTNSELFALWEESGELDQWLAPTREIEQRLG